MQPLLSSNPQRIAGAAVGVSLLAIGFLPLFGGPGYEQSLASGLIVPSVAAVATAVELSRGEAPSPLAAVMRGVASGLLLSAIAFVTALVHALRVGLCDLEGGAVGFALTAMFGAVLGGVWGVVVAEVARRAMWRRTVAVVGALSLPLCSAFFSVGRFYTSPMIFAFDPFVGYFSGTLYDTVIDAGTPLLTYRLGSAATLLAVILFASALTRDRARLRLVRFALTPGARSRLVGAFFAVLASLAVTVSGPRLGHWETSATIAAELGGASAGARCDVVYPASLLPVDSALLVKDCDEQLAAVEHELGARGPERIRAFFFRDSDEKKRLMGAADTLIAKPWRHEVYVQLSSYPHPVLGHELAHVVAGSFGRGPFRIAGGLGGLWPDPGLIEGIAVAASPDDDELDGTEWAHAMLETTGLPPIHEVFSVGFLGVAASKSYTLAGAFVRFIIDHYGREVVRAWYAGASLETLTGKHWSALDDDFRAYVAATPLLPEAKSFARARFERPAVFGRKCPHVVDALRRRADQCRDAHEVTASLAAYEDVLAHDPHDWGARYGLAVVQLRYGDETKGEGALKAVEDDKDAPRTWRDRAADALADHAFIRGDDRVARDEYESLAVHSLEEDFARTLEVKALATTDPSAHRAIESLLLGGPHRPADIVVAALEMGAWDARTESPLASYLVGRTLVGRGRYAEALPHLDQALTPGGSITPRIARETVRQRAVASCAEGARSEVERTRALVTAKDSPYKGSNGRRLSVLRLLDRCSVAGPPSRP